MAKLEGRSTAVSPGGTGPGPGAGVSNPHINTTLFWGTLPQEAEISRLNLLPEYINVLKTNIMMIQDPDKCFF